MRFPGQHEGETVKFLVRKHWVIDVKVASMTLFFYVLPFMVLVSLVIAYWPKFFSDFSAVVLLVVLIYLLFAELGLYIKWLNEELDLIIVTNMRVINLDQVTFMERTVSETSLNQIQDVKGVEKGVFSNVFHYGNLEIHTASHTRVFYIENVPEPFTTARKILAIRDETIKHNKEWTQTHSS